MTTDRKKLEAEAGAWVDSELRAFFSESGRLVVVQRLADWAERIQREAAAEERKEARLDVAAELVAVVKRYGMDGSRIIQAITDALDARSKP